MSYLYLFIDLYICSHEQLFNKILTCPDHILYEHSYLARARFVYDYALYKFTFIIIIILPPPTAPNYRVSEKDLTTNL